MDSIARLDEIPRHDERPFMTSLFLSIGKQSILYVRTRRWSSIHSQRMERQSFLNLTGCRRPLSNLHPHKGMHIIVFLLLSLYLLAIAFVPDENEYFVRDMSDDDSSKCNAEIRIEKRVQLNSTPLEARMQFN